jgi:hypothetical protein
MISSIWNTLWFDHILMDIFKGTARTRAKPEECYVLAENTTSAQ